MSSESLVTVSSERFLANSVDDPASRNARNPDPITSPVPPSVPPAVPAAYRECTEEEAASCLLSVVLCSPDRGPWPKITSLLGFVATLICDGVWLSLTLFDGRVGITERLPSEQTRILEHMAAISLFRYMIEPLSCAYLNRYGFRYCLFLGSILSITWIWLLSWFIDNPFNFASCFLLAIIGGIGMGVIKTTFFVLLSTLFIVNRPGAHLIFHLGSFTGMLLIPPLTEFVLLTSDWKSAMRFHLILMCFTLVFWLLVATPVPLKIQLIGDPNDDTAYDSQSWIATRSVDDSFDNLQFSTVRDTVGNKKLRMVPFTGKTPLIDCCKQPHGNVSSPVVNWLHEDHRNRPACIRNVTNMFKTRLIGSRPMYRDDILVDGNVFLFANNLNLREYAEYLMAMTRIFTVADLNDEKHKRFNVFPTAVSRVLKSMFTISIWDNEKSILFVASEALVHASCYVPFVFIKGPLGLKSSAEAMITLIVGCLGSLSGRGIGYLLHGTSLNVIPMYHVALVLMANSISLFLCVTIKIDKIIPYFGIFGFLFGYYKSVQKSVMYSIFPLKKFSVIYGQISIVRGLSSLLGILIAIKIQRDKEPAVGNEDVYVFAGILMMAGSVCIGLLALLQSDTATAIVRWPAINHRGPRVQRPLPSRSQPFVAL